MGDDAGLFAGRWGYSKGLIGTGGAGEIIIESNRGAKAAQFRLDLRSTNKMLTDHKALIDGDLYGIYRHGVIERYKLRGSKVVKAGIAIQMPLPADPTQSYWEHGANIQVVRQEHQHKCLQMERERYAQQHPKQILRAARLVARLCNKMEVTYEDARELSYCDAGIRGWCAKRGINPNSKATFAQLRGDSMSEAVILRVATKAVTTGKVRLPGAPAN